MKIVKELFHTVFLSSAIVILLTTSFANAAITLPGKGSPRVVAGTDYIAAPTYVFDEENRPYFLLSRTLKEFGRIETIRNNAWVDLNFREAWDQWIARADIPNLVPQVGNEPIFTSAIDAENSYYAVIRVFNADANNRWEPAVIYSPDITAATPEFKFYRFNKGGIGEGNYRTTAFVELNNSNNARTVTVDGQKKAVTPAMYLTRQISDQVWKYSLLSEARLYLPVKNGNELELGQGVVISPKAGDKYSHSGELSSFVTVKVPNSNGADQLRTYVAYQGSERSLPDMLVAAVDRTQGSTVGQIQDKTLFYTYPGPFYYGPTVPDGHLDPTLAVDKKGTIYLGRTGWGTPSQLFTSDAPYDISSFSTSGGAIFPRANVSGSSTVVRNSSYLDLAIGSDDKIHAVIRTRSKGVRGHGGPWALNYQRIEPGTTPAAAPVMDQYKIIANSSVVGGNAYRVFRQKLIRDRRDINRYPNDNKAIYVAAKDFSFQTGDDFPWVLLQSTDNGENFRIATRQSMIDRFNSNSGPAPTVSVAIKATADAFVQGGNAANTVFGLNHSASDRLVVKTINNKDSYTRRAYLKFNVNEVYGYNIVSAKLRGYVQLATSEALSATFSAKSVSDDSWDESTLTWSNAPAAGASLNTQTGASQVMEWDVTSYISEIAANSNDDWASIQIVSNSGSSPDARLLLHSLQGGDQNKVPELIIQYQ